METNNINVTRIAPLRSGGFTEQQAKDRLATYVKAGVGRAVNTIERVMNEVPEDKVIKASAFAFTESKQHQEIQYIAPGMEHELRLHPNALDQAADRAEIPRSYVAHLMGKEWGRNLLAANLNQHFWNMPNARFLTRSVGLHTKGILSDRFRRIDCRPSVEALIQVAHDTGAIVSDGIASEVRTSLKVISPIIVEPVPGEYSIFGLSWENSDYGKGAQTLRAFLLRLVCTNGATVEQAIRQVHLGGRLGDDIAYSDRTYQLDTEATTSAIRDMAKHLLGPQKREELVERIKQANEIELDGKAMVQALRKRVGKGEADKLVETFNGPDVVNLPPGNTAYRWSNAASWRAQQEDVTPDFKIELERLAGDLLSGGVRASA